MRGGSILKNKEKSIANTQISRKKAQNRQKGNLANREVKSQMKTLIKKMETSPDAANSKQRFHTSIKLPEKGYSSQPGIRLKSV